MGAKIRTAIIVVLGVATVLVGIQYLRREQPLAVVVAEVDKGIVESTVANTRAGSITACRRAHLSPAAGGQVSRLLVREGDDVTANQLLMELWNEDLQAEAQLAEREATASAAVAAQACLTADSSERDAKRVVELKKKNLVAEESVDRAVTAAQAQRAACRAAQARVDVSAARRTQVTALLHRTQLRAPFPGRVVELNVEVGEYVTPSPPGIPTLPPIDLSDSKCIYVLAPLDEVDAPKVALGMVVRITLDAFAGRSFDGRVRRIADYVLEREKQARTVDIEVDFVNPRDREQMLPGYSADVEVVLEQKEDVVRVPTAAILSKSQVLRYNSATQRLEAVTISAGVRNWKYTEVLSGLSAGDRIVTSIDRKGAVDGALVTPEAGNSSKSTP